MVTLPGTGHLLPLEAPAEVAKEIRRFLEYVGANPAQQMPTV
jgi:pimeloyl-ACP methyl ester carboxylesterase